MKVVFVNRYYFPDISATSQILTELAEDLASTQADVHVITSRSRYDDPNTRLEPFEEHGGVSVHRVWTTSFGRRSIGRVLDYLTFYLTASLLALRLVQRGDILVAKTDPPLISVPMAAIARIKGARLLNWLQDLFPEVAARLGVRLASGPLGSIMKVLRDWSARQAEMNICIGESMAAYLAARLGSTGSTLVISNWSDGRLIRPIPPESNSLRGEWLLGERVVFGYSGNMGLAHDLNPLLEAAKQLADRQDIAFLFIGDGKYRDELVRFTDEHGLRNVLFQPYQPRERLPLSLAAPDVHFVSLRPELEGLIVPSKLYGALSAGRPVIFLGDQAGEVARTLQSDTPCGFSVAPSDISSLTRRILELADDAGLRRRMGLSARALFEARFDRAQAISRWRALLLGAPA